MILQTFLKSQLYTKRSPNLTRLGFDFDQDPCTEFKKVQSMLYTEYHIHGESMLTIMKRFSIPSTRTMDILFRLFDIQSRSFSESQRLALELSRATPPTNISYQHIYHTTWYGDVVYLRSSYEQEYALALDQSKTKYLVEHMRIKYYDRDKKTYRIAVPDFYLPDSNTIVEVKSSYWLTEQEMKDKSDAYKALGFKFALYLDHKLIENW